jgi:hypothetical protein
MIKFDIKQLQELRKTLDEKSVNTALRWTLDAVTKKARTMISREVRKTYDIKASDIASNVQLQRFDRDATRLLLYTGSKTPLEKFKPQVKNVRVTVAHHRTGKRFQRTYQATTLKVRKDRGRRLAKGAFYHGKSVMRRSNKARGGFDSDQAFKQYGPSIPGMVGHSSILEQFEEMLRNDVGPTFSNRLEYILGKR